MRMRKKWSGNTLRCCREIEKGGLGDGDVCVQEPLSNWRQTESNRRSVKSAGKDGCEGLVRETARQFKYWEGSEDYRPCRKACKS